MIQLVARNLVFLGSRFAVLRLRTLRPRLRIQDRLVLALRHPLSHKFTARGLALSIARGIAALR